MGKREKGLNSFFVRVLLFLMLFSVIQYDTVSAEFSTVTLTNGVSMGIGVEHSRVEETEFYNGERVYIDMTFTGGTIDSGKTYQVSLPTMPNGSEYAYFLNMDETVDVMANGISVGSANYNTNTGRIDIVFDTAISASDVATISMGANMAIKENNVLDSQIVPFTIMDEGSMFSNSVVISTTNQGYVMDVTLSRTTNIQSYTGLTINIDWQALNGVGAGDYFEVTFPKVADDVLELSMNFVNKNEVLSLVKNGVTYGSASVVAEGNGNYKVVFNFTRDSNETNISGNIQFNGSWYLDILDQTVTRPTDKTVVIYINGEGKDFPVTIGTPNTDLSRYDVPIRKQDVRGSVLIGRDQEVAEGEAFYQFSWRVDVNLEGLPSISQIAGGKTMHNAIITDEVSGPGHYIDISYMRIHYFVDWDQFGAIKDLPILHDAGYPQNATRSWIDLSTYLSYVGADKLTTVPYGDGNPDHVKSFTLQLGDLPGVAPEVEYRSYVMEGSDEIIPSYRDYFYQSMMTSSGTSTDYFNTIILNSTEYVNEQIISKTLISDGSASMTSGNLNLKVVKVDANGNPQANVQFTLYWTGGATVKTTDSNGIIEFNEMGTGVYKLEETTPLEDYRPIDPVVFKIPDTVPVKYENGYIDLQDQATFTSSGGLDDIESFVVVNDTGIMEGYNEITNYLDTVGSFTVKKVDAEDPTQYLSDAGFILSRDNGGVKEYYTVEENIVTWVSDKTMATILKTNIDGSFTVENLLYGNYILEEVIAPVGYQLDITPISIVINETNIMVERTITNTKIVPIEPEEPKQPEQPVTGDSMPIMMWCSLLGISFASLVLLHIYKRKRKY